MIETFQAMCTIFSYLEDQEQEESYQQPSAARDTAYSKRGLWLNDPVTDEEDDDDTTRRLNPILRDVVDENNGKQCRMTTRTMINDDPCIHV